MVVVVREREAMVWGGGCIPNTRLTFIVESATIFQDSARRHFQNSLHLIRPSGEYKKRNMEVELWTNEGKEGRDLTRSKNSYITEKEMPRDFDTAHQGASRLCERIVCSNSCEA